MFEGFSSGIFFGAIAVLVVIGVLLLRPAPPIDAQFGGKRLGFSTRVPPAEAYRAVATLRAGQKLSVARADERTKRVLLGDRVSWTSWGFWYPVDFIARTDGGTDVSIGIRSKAIQWGPFVGVAHRKTLAAVQSAVEGRAA
jgi:uncharacterized membrane protein